MAPSLRRTGDSYFAWDGDTLVVNILGKPGARRDAVGTPLGTELRVSVTATAESGRATVHMLKFLAPLFGVPASRITVGFGQTSVHKQLRIQAPRQWPAVFGDAPPPASGR